MPTIHIIIISVLIIFFGTLNKVIEKRKWTPSKKGIAKPSIIIGFLISLYISAYIIVEIVTSTVVGAYIATGIIVLIYSYLIRKKGNNNGKQTD